MCEVEVSPDDLVRTATVEYSLLAELPEAERHLYKGITKKRFRVPVQRLVLILPVEERGPDLLCGGRLGYTQHLLMRLVMRLVMRLMLSLVMWLTHVQRSRT